MSAQRKPKALALVSGGLDSMLAVRMVQEQGCEVVGVNFYTTFAGDDDRQFKKDGEVSDSARRSAKELGITLLQVDLTIPFQEILYAPHYGWGSVINPCLDCKLFFIKEAYQLMRQEGMDFLVTGEVVGQRPMSQRIDTLPLAISLTDNHIVRPLSAKLLPESYPEQMGWLDREKLGAISGRGRAAQMEMAKKFGFRVVPQPAGGCLLTDPGFGRRMKDFMQRFDKTSYSPWQLQLLRVGRHLKVSDALKLVVGRNEWENEWLQRHEGVFFWAQARDYPGATVVIQAGQDASATQLVLTNEEFALVAEVALHFSKARSRQKESGGSDGGAGLVDVYGRDAGGRRFRIIKEVAIVQNGLQEDRIAEWYL